MICMRDAERGDSMGGVAEAIMTHMEVYECLAVRMSLFYRAWLGATSGKSAPDDTYNSLRCVERLCALIRFDRYYGW